jgi:hypothetical protein
MRTSPRTASTPAGEPALGEYFGCDGHVRLNFGFGADYVGAALAAVGPVVDRLC